MKISMVGLVICGVCLGVRAEVYEPQIQIRFPDQIAQLPLIGRHQFPTPELGVSLGYQGTVRATVYVYHAGFNTIPTDIHAPVLYQQIGQASQDIQTMQRRGAIQQLQAIDPEPRVMTHVGCGTTFLRQQFRFMFAQENAPMLSSAVYLTSLNNHFVKLRISYPQSDQSAEAQANEFVRQIGRLLAGCDTPADSV